MTFDALSALLGLAAGLLIGGGVALWALRQREEAAPPPPPAPEFDDEALVRAAEQRLRPAIEARVAEAERMALAPIEDQARRLLVDAMQRTAAATATEASATVFSLASDDLKGRIIGREGRNIRTFEQVTGVDLLVDETPDAVVLSCFDPVRREIARRTLEELVKDGRIHPSRIEEVHARASEEVERAIAQYGRDAAKRAGVSGLRPRVIETLGRLRYRASLAQNVLEHSVEVATFAAVIASELGMDAEVARRAGLLHDIGKALADEGPHALTGMRFLQTHGESAAVLHAVGAHHHDIEPESAEAVLVILADTVSATRPGARRESLAEHLERMEGLESLASSMPGVRQAFAVKSGRELRVIVEPEAIDDLAANVLAGELVARIRADLNPSVPVVVTVIRETRASAST